MLEAEVGWVVVGGGGGRRRIKEDMEFISGLSLC